MFKKVFSYLMLAAVAGLFLWTGDALAQNAVAPGGTGSSTEVWDLAFGRTLNAFINARTVIFIVGGFGLIALAFSAIFGKIQWKWFAALCVGLAIVAAAGYIVEYATGAQDGGSQSGAATGLTSTISN